MKRFSLLITILFLVEYGSAQWVKQTTSFTFYTLFSVYFTDPDTGYAVGYYNTGAILKTPDGGNTWVDITPGVIQLCYSVFFTGMDTGYIVGDSGLILKTTDGGTSWTNQVSGTLKGLYSVYFTDSDTGYIVGDSGMILKTTDGGSSWADISYVTSKYLTSAFFINTNTGYLVGSGGLILKTINGGISWMDQSRPFGDFKTVYFISADTGYIAGNNYSLYAGDYNTLFLKTTNGGLDWTAVGPDYFGIFNINSLFFTETNTGYAAGNGLFNYGGVIVKTIDGGLSWTTQYFDPFYASLYSVTFTDPDTGYAVGFYEDYTWHPAIMKTTDGGGYPYPLDTKDLSSNPEKLKIFPNPATDNIRIEIPAGKPESKFIVIMNYEGQELLNQKIIETNSTIDLRRFVAGLYFVKFSDGQTVQVNKFIKK